MPPMGLPRYVVGGILARGVVVVAGMMMDDSDDDGG